MHRQTSAADAPGNLGERFTFGPQSSHGLAHIQANLHTLTELANINNSKLNQSVVTMPKNHAGCTRAAA